MVDEKSTKGHIISSIKSPQIALYLTNFLKAPSVQKIKHQMLLNEEIFLHSDGTFQLENEITQINSYKLRLYLKQLDKINVFNDIMHMIKLIKTIDYLEQKILQPNCQKVFASMNLEEEQLVEMGEHYIVDMNMKSFLFDYRILVDKLLLILNELYFILKEDTQTQKNEQCTQPSRDFTTFYKGCSDKKHRNLNPLIIKFLKNNLNYFLIVRSIRSQIKDGECFKYKHTKIEGANLLLCEIKNKKYDKTTIEFMKKNQMDYEKQIIGFDMLSFIKCRNTAMIEFVNLIYSILSKKINLKPQKTILIDAMNTFIIKDQGIFQDMYTLLEQYYNPKIILSNANDEEMETFGLTNVPYEVFTLKHEPNKPDPKYFETMLKHFDFKAEDVIYFEHDGEAVKSAQSLNITSYHYDKDKKDLVALKNFLDNNL
ncbi:hypothetical protein KBC40_01960 [Patescibacteria group bacterium]|nr:hypothetical protein [Patescibacteria group bacterium]